MMEIFSPHDTKTNLYLGEDSARMLNESSTV